LFQLFKSRVIVIIAPICCTYTERKLGVNARKR